MRLRLILPCALLAAVMAMAGGCNTSGCTDNRSSLLLAGFYSTSLKVIAVDSLELGGVDAPADSLLVDLDSRPNEVYLPLRSQHTTTSFFLHYAAAALRDPANNDTITLDYTTEPFFASEECGAVYRYRVKRLEYTRHLIDSIALPDSLIDNADVQRMKIIFRTAETEQP